MSTAQPLALSGWICPVCANINAMREGALIMKLAAEAEGMQELLDDCCDWFEAFEGQFGGEAEEVFAVDLLTRLRRVVGRGA